MAAVADGLAGQFCQRHVGVGQFRWVGLRGGAHQGLDGVGDIPCVDVHASQHRSALHPEGDELAAGDVAAEDDLVVAATRYVAGILHATVVLVGEEVGHLVVGGGRAHHVRRCDRPLVEGGRPVLEAQVGAQQRVVGVGDIAGGEYIRVDGGQVLVEDDAVVDRQTYGRGQLDIGQDAHADHDRV